MTAGGPGRRFELLQAFLQRMDEFSVIESPAKTIETNIKGTELVLELAARKRKKVVITSTSEIYGPKDA